LAQALWSTVHGTYLEVLERRHLGFSDGSITQDLLQLLVELLLRVWVGTSTLKYMTHTLRYLSAAILASVMVHPL
jgi:hypothetical protein